MANEGQKAGVDPTLKLSNDRLREVFAWSCGATRWAILGGGDRETAPPTDSEIASALNELISNRFAVGNLEESCKELEAEVERLELEQRSCA